jgi:hypothetical protein
MSRALCGGFAAGERQSMWWPSCETGTKAAMVTLEALLVHQRMKTKRAWQGMSSLDIGLIAIFRASMSQYWSRSWRRELSRAHRISQKYVDICTGFGRLHTLSLSWKILLNPAIMLADSLRKWRPLPGTLMPSLLQLLRLDVGRIIDGRHMLCTQRLERLTRRTGVDRLKIPIH